MGELFNSFATVTVFNSVTNNLDDEKLDTNNPFSFIEFLNYSKDLTNEIENFRNYNEYIRNWNNFVKNSNTSLNVDVKNQYLEMFRELSLKYSSIEEQRYLETLDFNNEENLSIAIPFYSRKIKEICLYFKEKRNQFSKDLRNVKNKGTINNLENFIKSTVVDLFEGDDVPPNVSTSLPLSSLQNNLSIEIEEAYDTFNDYFDLDPNKQPDFYNATLDRKELFSSNTNDINSQTFIDLDQAIINLINDKGIVLEELLPSRLSAQFNTSDENLLDNNDYINYKKSDRENLNLLFEAELVKNLIGTDFYFLSTNSFGNLLSGELFEGKNKVNNLLNINYPSTLTVPSTSNDYVRDLGLFFKPPNFSILKMKGGYDVTLKENLSTNSLYIFPDPNSFGDISGLSKTVRDNPFDFVLKEDVYKNTSSGVSQKNVKSFVEDQNFYSYNSFEQYRNNLNLLSSFNNPYSNFVNKGILQNINTDIFGNNFLEYINDTSFVQNFKKDSIVKNKEAFVGSNTLTAVNYNTEKLNFLEKQLAIKDVFVQNISTNEFKPISASFSNIFSKYLGNTSLYNELNNSIKNINIYEDVFSIDTPSFTIIDDFIYNGEFLPTTNQPLIIPVTLTDDKFTGVSNDYFVDNRIYKVVINLFPSASTTNDIFYYEFFSYDLNKNKEIPIINRKNTQDVYFEGTFNLGLSAVPKRLRNVSLTYSSKLNTFNLVSQYNDLNDNLYVHNFVYKLFNNVLSIVDNTLYTPINYYNTNNFFTTNLSSTFFVTSLSGEVEQNKEEGVIFI